jgi:hypothetical protein
MKNYLDFTEFDDNSYSEEDEYSIIGGALGALSRKQHNKLKRNNNYKKVKTPNSTSPYRRSNAWDRFKHRYNENRKEDKAEKYDKLRNTVVSNGKQNRREEIKNAGPTSRQRRRAEQIDQMRMDEAEHKGTRKKNFKRAGVTALGAGAGAGIGNLAATKLKKQLAVITLKENKSEEDLKKIKTLKRKIIASTALGAAGGAGIAYLASKKLSKK